MTAIENAIDNWVARNRATWQVSQPEPGPEIHQPAESPVASPAQSPTPAEPQSTAAAAESAPPPADSPAEPSTASPPPVTDAVTIDDL